MFIAQRKTFCGWRNLTFQPKRLCPNKGRGSCQSYATAAYNNQEMAEKAIAVWLDLKLNPDIKKLESPVVAEFEYVGPPIGSTVDKLLERIGC